MPVISQNNIFFCPGKWHTRHVMTQRVLPTSISLDNTHSFNWFVRVHNMLLETSNNTRITVFSGNTSFTNVKNMLMLRPHHVSTSSTWIVKRNTRNTATNLDNNMLNVTLNTHWLINLGWINIYLCAKLPTTLGGSKLQTTAVSNMLRTTQGSTRGSCYCNVNVWDWSYSWSTERALANNNHRDLNPQSLVSVVVRTYWFVSELR